MRKTRIAAITTVAALALTGTAAIATAGTNTPAAPGATSPKPVAKLCKHGSTSVYSKAACRSGDTAITLKGLVGPAGPVGPQGPKGDPGDASGFVRVCKTVTVNADYVNGTLAERTIKIEGLPMWTDFAGPAVMPNGDLVSSNLRAVRDTLGTPGLTVTAANIPTDGSTVRYFEVSGGLGGVTGSETAQLAVCVGRMGVQVA